ncbi:MAG: hypothetical protein AAFS10_06820 [Myxococcota bacterium]
MAHNRFERMMDRIETAQQMGFTFKRGAFAFRTDALWLHQRVAEAGFGIAAVPSWVSNITGLVQFRPEVCLPGLSIDLTAYPDPHRNPRVVRVWPRQANALGVMVGAEGSAEQRAS